jgi:hypothetical protein
MIMDELWWIPDEFFKYSPSLLDGYIGPRVTGVGSPAMSVSGFY